MIEKTCALGCVCVCVRVRRLREAAFCFLTMHLLLQRASVLRRYAIAYGAEVTTDFSESTHIVSEDDEVGTY